MGGNSQVPSSLPVTIPSAASELLRNIDHCDYITPGPAFQKSCYKNQPSVHSTILNYNKLFLTANLGGLKDLKPCQIKIHVAVMYGSNGN